MRFALLFTCFLLLFFSCRNISKEKTYPDIVIEEGLSYKWDFKNQLYFVNSMGLDNDSIPTMPIRFTLSESEKQAIIDKFHKAGLHNINSDKYIEDRCHIMPKIFTTLYIKKEGNKVIKIEIDESCTNYKNKNSVTANRIKAFIQFVRMLLHSKPEIKNAPKSNVIYF